MDRRIIKIGKIAIVLAPLFLILPFALAENAKYVGEDYYGNDINAAVLEADQNKRQLNYNKQHWFNRTTSRSFELDPLIGTELEKERLEGALGSTAAGGDKNEATPELPSKEQADRIQRELVQDSSDTDNNNNVISPAKDYTLDPIYTPTLKTSHQFPRGDIVTSTGILSTGTVISTPRP